MIDFLIAIRDALLAIVLSWGGMEFDRSDKKEEAKEANAQLVRLAVAPRPDCSEFVRRLDSI